MAYIPAVVLTAGIAVISLWEAPQLPPPVMSLGDKALHGAMYLVLAVFWMIPIVRQFSSRLVPYICVWAAVTIYGGVLELLQHFCTRTRSGEVADLYADAIGAVVGVGLVALGYWIITRKNGQSAL